jgi:hypothetical protein
MITGSESPFYLPVLEVITKFQLLRTTLHIHCFPFTLISVQVATHNNSKTSLVAVLEKQSNILEDVSKIIPGLSTRRASLFLVAGSDKEVITV